MIITDDEKINIKKRLRTAIKENNFGLQLLKESFKIINNSENLKLLIDNNLENFKLEQQQKEISSFQKYKRNY